MDAEVRLLKSNIWWTFVVYNILIRFLVNETTEFHRLTPFPILGKGWGWGFYLPGWQQQQ
jgi:hypothetical protein